MLLPMATLFDAFLGTWQSGILIPTSELIETISANEWEMSPAF